MLRVLLATLAGFLFTMFAVCAAYTWQESKAQLWDTLGYGCKVDEWAIGCIVYEMLVGESPFQHKQSEAKLYASIMRNEHVAYLKRVASESARAAVRAFLMTKPAERISCAPTPRRRA